MFIILLLIIGLLSSRVYSVCCVAVHARPPSSGSD